MKKIYNIGPVEVKEEEMALPEDTEYVVCKKGKDGLTSFIIKHDGLFTMRYKQGSEGLLDIMYEGWDPHQGIAINNMRSIISSDIEYRQEMKDIMAKVEEMERGKEKVLVTFFPPEVEVRVLAGAFKLEIDKDVWEKMTEEEKQNIMVDDRIPQFVHSQIEIMGIWPGGEYVEEKV